MSRNDGTQILGEGTISTEAQPRQFRPEVRDSEMADLFSRGIRRTMLLLLLLRLLPLLLLRGGVITRLTYTHGANRSQGTSRTL